MNHVQLARLHPLMREAIRDMVRACQNDPFNLTPDQLQAMNRGSALLRAIDALPRGPEKRT